MSTLRFPDAVPELASDAVYLRELTEGDIPAWFARATDVESADLAGDPIPESIDVGPRWLQQHRDRFHQRVAIRWAIVKPRSTESVGTVGLSITSTDDRVAELGIVIGRAHWGEGLGTAAAELATRYALDTLGLAEIQAEVLQRNLASVRLLEKTGFRLLRAIEGDPQANSE
ncbi:MAG: hypothetical protein QOF21_1466, partial [Actinomycetota bacterium]